MLYCASMRGEIRQDGIDAVGAQVFGLLVSLLRPVVRRRGRAGVLRDARRSALPAQRMEVQLRQQGSVAAAEIQLWLSGLPVEPMSLAWTLPLPAQAAVESLALRCPGGQEAAGVCERREAREWFDLARRSGLAGALLAEDAPGVFGLEVETPGCGALHLRMSHTWRASDEADLDLSARCEADPAGGKERTRATRLLRLGASHRLDRLFGIVGEAGRTRLIDAVMGRRARQDAGTTRPDVFATCDRADGSGAMYRGSLGGRAVRLWADLHYGAVGTAVLPEPHPVAEISRLMAAYRAADCSDARRRDLAAAVARLGLEARVATLWTSFVAVVGSRDPGGERVFAAA